MHRRRQGYPRQRQFRPDGQGVGFEGETSDYEVRGRAVIILDDICRSHPRHPLTPSQRSFKEHKGTLLSVALTPDCEIVASSARDGSVRVWEAR